MAASETLFKKLQLKAEEHLLLLNVPADLAAIFQERPHSTQAEAGKTYPAVLVFVQSKAELKHLAPTALQAIAEGGKLWMAYPKKSSAIKTDINRDTGWAPLTNAGWSGVTQIAIDETWSALRFKPKADIKSKQPRMTNTGPGQKSERAILLVPDYLEDLLGQHPKEKIFFESLAYTHRKEYINWLAEAKKPETRDRRLEKMLEMLAEGKKNRMV